MSLKTYYIRHPEWSVWEFLSYPQWNPFKKWGRWKRHPSLPVLFNFYGFITCVNNGVLRICEDKTSWSKTHHVVKFRHLQKKHFYSVFYLMKSTKSNLTTKVKTFQNHKMLPSIFLHQLFSNKKQQKKVSPTIKHFKTLFLNNKKQIVTAFEQQRRCERVKLYNSV